MPSQTELFPRPPRPHVWRMHVHDAGDRVIEFQCQRCGHNTGWIDWDNGVAKAKRGIPCPKCNAETAEKGDVT